MKNSKLRLTLSKALADKRIGASTYLHLVTAIAVIVSVGVIVLLYIFRVNSYEARLASIMNIRYATYTRFETSIAQYNMILGWAERHDRYYNLHLMGDTELTDIYARPLVDTTKDLGLRISSAVSDSKSSFGELLTRMSSLSNLGYDIVKITGNLMQSTARHVFCKDGAKTFEIDVMLRNQITYINFM